MRFGIDLPPQMKVFGAFFVYSFCMGSMFPRLRVKGRSRAISGKSSKHFMANLKTVPLILHGLT